jgi:hypothetical protein
MDLATKIAALQFENRDYVLMFRGQNGDFKNKAGNSSLRPRLLRARSDPKKVASAATLEERFQKLRRAEALLVHEYKACSYRGLQRLQRQRALRWSVLQHYEICDTPLLDVTQSLRVAASFASHDVADFGYVFVVGVPHVSGAITASAESGLQVVRLASVCPPTAVRPHIQEGYLLGEYPEFSSVKEKALYKNYEIDFGRRLIAKFRFIPTTFWQKSKGFPEIPRTSLYPPAKSDPLCGLADRIKTALSTR